MENITDITRLKKLAKEINIWGGKSKAFTVQLPFLTERENEDVSKKVNKFYNTCGCGQGRVAGVFTFSAFIILVATGIVSIAQIGIGKTIAGYFLISFISMVVTKIFMLVMARRKFYALINNLESIHLNPTPTNF